jgi:hypothetical protein
MVRIAGIPDITGMESEGLFQKRRPRLYVGYDHFADGPYFDAFKRMFSSLYEIERDNSLERELGGDDAEGFIRHLRDEALADCACAVILCGGRTHLGKFVDWEIKAALDRKLSVIGIVLPTNPEREGGQPLLPERLRLNFDGGFAVICRWQEISEGRIDLSSRVNFAMARPVELIENSPPPRADDG